MHEYEPNRLVVMVWSPREGTWLDYFGIKELADVDAAIQLRLSKKGKYRVHDTVEDEDLTILQLCKAKIVEPERA